MLCDKKKVQRRLYRLFLPYVFWTCAYWLFYVFLSKILDFGETYGVSDLLWQLLFGHRQSMNPPMWFQADLIILFIIFIGIFFVCKKGRWEY